MSTLVLVELTAAEGQLDNLVDYLAWRTETGVMTKLAEMLGDAPIIRFATPTEA